MKILSFNIRNWTRDCDKSSPFYWKRRLSSAETMVKYYRPDVICLQECLPPVTSHFLKLGYRRAGFGFSHLTLVRKGLNVGRRGFRIFLNYADIGKLRIINVHSRWNWWILRHTVRQLNRLTSKQSSVACGDFNNEREQIYDAGLQMLHTRSYNGMEKEDTFRNFTNPGSHGEIDHFYTNCIWNKMDLTIIKEGCGCNRMSDHYPLLLEIR